jgi:hypothetical protein
MVSCRNEFSFLAYKNRHSELLREVENARLVRQMQTGQGGRNRFYFRVLTRLGRRLVIWGWRLQECYGAATTAPALPAADRHR